MTQKEIYDEYLLSQHWHDLREEVFNRSNRRCATCSAKPRHGHHLVYRTPLESCTADDIMALCERCHNLWHEWLKKMSLHVHAFCRDSTRGGILVLLNPLKIGMSKPKKAPKLRKSLAKSKPIECGASEKEQFLSSRELAESIATMNRDRFKSWIRGRAVWKNSGKVISKAFQMYDKAKKTRRRDEPSIINGVYHA